MPNLYADIPSPTLTDPELIAERVHAAIAEIASICPVNAEEARIATRVVTADALARESIRHARTLLNEPIRVMRCHAQADHLLRTANAARALLLRVQAARQKREAVQATCDQDALTIHAIEGLLLAADGQSNAAAPPPPKPPPPATDDDDKFARYDEAERYGVIYPRRAAEIRAYGGVPPTATYGPTRAGDRPGAHGQHQPHPPADRPGIRRRLIGVGRKGPHGEHARETESHGGR